MTRLTRFLAPFMLIVLVLLAGWVLASVARAQAVDNGTISAQDAGSGSASTCATANACVTFTVPTEAPAVVVQVVGTCSCTLTFDGTVDGTNYITIGGKNMNSGSTVTTTTGAGLFSFTNPGLVKIRVRASNYGGLGPETITFSRGWLQ